MTKATIAPISSTIKGLSSELPVGPANGLDRDCVVALDNVVTVTVRRIGRTVGHLRADQEAQLARALVLAYDLEGDPRAVHDAAGARAPTRRAR